MAVFQAGGGLHPEEHRRIIVQRAELDRILAHIHSGDLYVALSGPRQTGKTTLLYQLQTRLHGHGYGVVYIDLSGLSDLNKAQFYQYMCTEISRGLTALIAAAGETALSPDAITDQTTFARYLVWLAMHTPPARKLLIVLDEVGGVPTETAATFFPSLRSFFHNGRRPANEERQFYQKILFIFAGAMDIRQLMRGNNSPLRNICEHFSLADLSQEHVQSLASNLTGFAPRQVEALAQVVHRWCDGHPYLTQRLFTLIDASEACRNGNLQQLPEAVEHLVAGHFLYGNDANLHHVLHYVRESETYRDQVFTILTHEGERCATVDTEDLLSIGIIKRASNHCLIIRNDVYRQALRILFAESERN
jgi:hypothetical protein